MAELTWKCGKSLGVAGAGQRWRRVNEAEHGLEVAAAVGIIAHRFCLLFALVELARQVRTLCVVSGSHDFGVSFCAP